MQKGRTEFPKEGNWGRPASMGSSRQGGKGSLGLKSERLWQEKKHEKLVRRWRGGLSMFKNHAKRPCQKMQERGENETKGKTREGRFSRRKGEWDAFYPKTTSDKGICTEGLSVGRGTLKGKKGWKSPALKSPNPPQWI